MTSGGARARSGPPADINSYRQQRKDADGWLNLPREVPRRRAPNWPLKPAPSDRERELWRKHWRMGQSIIWEARGQEIMLAIYIRLLATIEGDMSEVPASKITQVRIMAEDLGISLSGMTRHRWRFAKPEDEQKQATEKAVGRTSRQSTAEQLASLLKDDPDDEEA